MIPISLTIQGIYSYQEKQTINFNKLTAAGIFGIFGPVGSGKSTILEAITFALYGRTDRLNLSGDNRNYNMMNLKSNEMIIEFVFKAGCQDEYMAQFRSRRNSKQFEDVKAGERTAYKKEGNEWIPIDVNTLESIIGLGYDNFKRTIIIPQGKFQEFLLLKGSERSEMLKELFNLDRFELSSRVISLESKTNQQKQIIEGNLQQLGDITPEQIQDAENTLAQTLEAIKAQTLELKAIEAEETHQRRIKDLFGKVRGYQSELMAMQQQEQEISVLEKQLLAFEYCLVNFRDLLNSYETSRANINHLNTNISADETCLKEISLQLKDLEAAFEHIRKEYDSRDTLKQKAEELGKIVKIIDLNERYAQFRVRITNGEKLVMETAAKVDALKLQQQKLAGEIKDLKEQYPDMTRLTKAKEWFTMREVQLLAAKEIETDKSVLNAQMEMLGQQKATLFNSDCFAGISIAESYDGIIALLDEKKHVHQNAIEVLVNEKQHYQVQQKLEEYASALNDGKPCPLCGSTTHPEKFNSENIHDSLLKIEKEITNHEKILKSIDEGLKKFTEINTALCLKEESQSRLIQKLGENRQVQESHQQLFCWDEFREEKDLTAMFGKAETIRKETEAKERELETVRHQTEKESNNREMYTKAIGDLKNNSIQELTTANTLKDQLSILKFDDYATSNPEVLTKEKENLLLQYKTIEEKYLVAEIQLNKLKREQDTLLGKLDTNRKMLEKEQLQLGVITARIDEKLKQSLYQSVDEVKQILAWNVDLESERKKVNAFRNEMDFVQKQLAMLNEELNGCNFEQEQYEKLLQTIEQLKQEISLKNQEKGKLEATIRAMKEDAGKRARLFETMSKLVSRLDDIKTLKQLFKGSGFVKYISSVYLQELIQSANERFHKLSGQKLSLEINQDNDFEIRDYMNGGKLRNVKTLSGGQMFQAALSLALALSDNKRKLSGASENFFFLDEGFGSLDKESLSVVFETLKALRKENRIVGVISHVEEMNQEIDIHLRIKNHEEKGSYIEKSWEG